MFYDLERPLEFVREVADILADDGIWHLEQSYLPAMLRANAYDTVCHEHVEYYAVAQIKWLADKVGLTILDVEENDVNGGGFAGALRRGRRRGEGGGARGAGLLGEERRPGLGSPLPLKEGRRPVIDPQPEP